MFQRTTVRGDQICYCDRCRKIRETEGSEIGCQLVLVNAVAEAVEKEYPHVVGRYAGLSRHGATAQAHAAASECGDSVVQRSVSAMTIRSRQPNARFGQTIAKWAKIHNRIYIWDYNTNFHTILAPMPNIDVMADNIRFWVKNHAEGVMLARRQFGPGGR